MHIQGALGNRILSNSEIEEFINRNNLIEKIYFITSKKLDEDDDLRMPESDYLIQDLCRDEVVGIQFQDLVSNVSYIVSKLDATHLWKYVSTQLHLF